MPTKREKREAEENKEGTREGCYGTYSDDDEDCNDDCPDYDDCVERTKEIEDGLSEDTDEDDEVEEAEDDPDEELDETESEAFDPASVDLSDSATRIDTLADLSIKDLLSIAEHHKVKISDDAKKDESEVMILIDDYFDNLPGEKPEEKSESNKEEEKPEPDPDSDEDGEPEEEEKPKPRKRRKKKAEPEIQEDFVDLDEKVEDVEDTKTEKMKLKISSKDSAIVASDVVMEVIEIILDRSEAYLVAHVDLDHMVGVRDKLDSIIKANKALGGSVDSPDIEPEPEEAEKSKPRQRKKKEADLEPELEPDDLEDEEPEGDEPVYPDHPDYFAEIAEANGAKVFVKGDTVSMKVGPTVLAMLALYKGKWQVVFNKGKLEKLPGTKPYKAPRKYPAIPADHAKAGKLLDFHVKTRKRGMRKPNVA